MRAKERYQHEIEQLIGAQALVYDMVSGDINREVAEILGCAKEPLESEPHTPYQPTLDEVEKEIFDGA